MLMYNAPVFVAGIFVDVLSTIKSPVFSGVAVFYRDHDFNVLKRMGRPPSDGFV